MNFRQLDLNLLRVLAAIHRTGSVTAAGKALSLSQPATSNALSRLRDYFQDDLFVRSPGGLQATRLCERLAPEVQAQLQMLETAVTVRDQFDPAHSDMRWRLSLSDLGEMMFLPPLAAALRQQAPQSHLTNVSVAAEDVPAALESREIDFAIGILQPRHRGARRSPLFAALRRHDLLRLATCQRQGRSHAQRKATGRIVARGGRTHRHLSWQRGADAGAPETQRPRGDPRTPLWRASRARTQYRPADHRAADVRVQRRPTAGHARVGTATRRGAHLRRAPGLARQHRQGPGAPVDSRAGASAVWRTSRHPEY